MIRIIVIFSIIILSQLRCISLTQPYNISPTKLYRIFFFYFSVLLFLVYFERTYINYYHKHVRSNEVTFLPLMSGTHSGVLVTVKLTGGSFHIVR